MEVWAGAPGVMPRGGVCGNFLGSCEPWTLQGGQGKDGGVSRKDGFSKGSGDVEVKGDQACKSEQSLRAL